MADSVERDPPALRALERQLRTERERLAALVATVPGVVWESWGEPDGAGQRIAFVSDHVEKMLGYTVEEWLGTPNFWLTIVHPDDREAAVRTAAQTFAAGGKPGVNRFRWIRKDGEIVWVESRSAAILDDDGKPVGLRGVTLDVTAQVAAEGRARSERSALEAAVAARVEDLQETDRRYREVVDRARDGIVAVDAEGRIAFANLRARELLGGDLVGEPFARFVHPEAEEVFDAALEARRRGQVHQYDLHLRRPDGTDLWVIVASAPTFDAAGRFTGATKILTDITDRRVAEAQRERLVREQAAREEAENARKRQAWLADVSAQLGASLDLQTTLQNVAHLVVPSIADWCAVHLLEDGRLEPVAVAHVDPERVAWARSLQDRFPPDPGAPSGAWHVVRTGEPELHPEITDALLVRAVKDEEALRLLRGLGLVSSITVPLQAHGKTLGTLGLVSCRDDRHYDREDLAVAMEIARRCAIAVENARLYADAQRELAEREAAEARLRDQARRQAALLEIGRAALREESPEDLASRVVARVAETLGVDAVVLAEPRQGRKAVVVGAYGLEDGRVGGLEDLGPDTLAAAALAQGRVVVADGSIASYRLALAPQTFSPRSAAAGVLVAKGRPVGVIAAFSREPGRFGPVEAQFLEAAGHLAAAAFVRLRATADLAAEKERLAVTLGSIADGVVATDTDARVTMMNRVAQALTGWAEADAIGRPLAEVFPVVHPRTRQVRQNPVDRALATGTVVEPSHHPAALLGRDGGERLVADSAAPIRDADGRVLGAVLVFRDVTDQERVEEELRRASTLDSLGVLAGGIAHDFNNILTGILASLSLARLHASPGDRMLARLSDAERAALRARDLTQQLLTFAKGGAPVKKATALPDVVRESTAFVLAGSNVRARFEVDPDLWVVEADAGQISQVVQNLTINAQQAMPDGGAVCIKLANETLAAPTGLPLPAGRYVRLDVVDRGPGIAPEHLARIFDPFFTTKPQGNGLGLATVYAIVRRHEGHVAVRSQPGEGTVFSVYLPASGGAAPAPAATPPATPGIGRVLVMDDEEMIRELAHELLVELGYDVSSASDGEEAVRLFREAQARGEPFDLVVLDLTVPGGMGGKQTIQELQLLDPNVRAVVSSGYSDDPVMADYRRHGFCAVMAKPYTVQEMSAVLARALEGSAGAKSA